ncbi:sensor histidine kinase [Paenibacillus hodogayensis]|uniref:histidine kinase n=1 Tax=Paenibacillus hodogayensis TaxID=279208 RepID=A0ABV5VUD1_9BACL
MGKRRRLSSSTFAKLFLTLAAASLLSFSGLLYGAIDGSRAALTQQKAEDMTLFVERTGQYLDLYLMNIRNTLIGLSDRMEGLRAADRDQVRQLLQESVRRNGGIISYMYVQFGDGTIVSNDQLAYSIVGHPSLPDVFRIAEETPGLVNWSDLYYSPMLTGPTVAFALKLRSGAVTVLAEINTPQLTRRLYEMLQVSGQGFALFTGQGSVVSYDPYSRIVPFKPATLPPEMDETFVQSLIGGRNGMSRVEGATGPLLVVKSERNELGWYLVTLTDERDFRAGSRDVVARFVGIGAISFSLLLVLTLFISRHYTTPLNRLAKQMAQIRGERFTGPYLPVGRSDEIGRLSRSFYAMLGRIRELLTTVRENEERKKELELALLLHQIRPHFLYNTLACIGSLAKQHRVAEVEETIRSLIGLLTYSTRKGDYVSLEEELQSLREYMHIQNVRYGGAFRFAERIEPGLAHVPVPKLILQPLVENAVFHGLAPRGEGEVIVSARAEDGRLLLAVRDDGEGMSAERIAAALADLPRPVDNDNAPEAGRTGRLQGIGLANVRERLRVHYGPQYGLAIRSEPGRWTEVAVTVPLGPSSASSAGER